VIRADVLVCSPIFLSGLVDALNDAGIKVVAERTSPLVEPSWLADVALIDGDAIHLPDDVVHIAQVAKSAAVLMLNIDAYSQATICLRAGASGVVSKTESREGLVAAIRVVTSGTKVSPDTVNGNPVVAPADDERAPNLSKREQQVLGQISQGLTHGQIATRLDISPHTVDTYVKRIRAKLGVGNKAELTRAALLLSQQVTEPPVRSEPECTYCCDRFRPGSVGWADVAETPAGVRTASTITSSSAAGPSIVLFDGPNPNPTRS